MDLTGATLPSPYPNVQLAVVPIARRVRSADRRAMGEESCHSRRLLLDTGIELLGERGVTSPVAHIRLKDVVTRAGLTTGAAYRLWDYQEDFHVDLAASAMRRRDGVATERIAAAIADLLDAAAPLEEIVRVASDAHVDLYATDAEPSVASSFLVMLALRSAAQSHEELQAASRERNAGSLDSFIDLYTVLMDRYGRRPREPFGVRDLAVAIAALGEGFAIQAIEGEDHPRVKRRDSDGLYRDWPVLGVAIMGCVEAFTEPVDDAPER